MADQKITLTLDVTYDDDVTDSDAVAGALSKIFREVTDTPGLLEDEGIVRISDVVEPDEVLDGLLSSADITGCKSGLITVNRLSLRALARWFTRDEP